MSFNLIRYSYVERNTLIIINVSLLNKIKAYNRNSRSMTNNTFHLVNTMNLQVLKDGCYRKDALQNDVEKQTSKCDGLFFRSQSGLFEIQITLDGPLIGLFLIALATRLYRLEYPRAVV